MFKFLEYLFITKKYNDTDMTTLKRSAYGTLTSLLGIICNFLLCAVKILCGVFSGSISLLADGINNLTDSAASVTTLVGFKLASAPADDKHPFGHERIEYVCGMFVSLFILLVGVLLGKSSIEKIISNENPDLSKFYLLCSVLFVSILVKFWMGMVYKKVGKKINSTAICASGQDCLNDCISTFAVLISLIICKFTSLNIDGWLGLLVSLFILVNGVKLVFETISPLIGEAASDEDAKKLINKIKSYEGVLGIHDLVMHSYGPKRMFATVHVEVDSKVDVLISHEIIDEIERSVINELGIELTIHLDPIETNDEYTNYLKDVLFNIINQIGDISFHDFRIVKGEKSVNVLFDIVRPYDYEKSGDELKEIIIKEFTDKLSEVDDITYRLIIDVDNSYVRMETKDE